MPIRKVSRFDPRRHGYLLADIVQSGTIGNFHETSVSRQVECCIFNDLIRLPLLLREIANLFVPLCVIGLKFTNFLILRDGFVNLNA